ncbi:hypothetical protein ACF0H5_021940 [Mactra antiquata]
MDNFKEFMLTNATHIVVGTGILGATWYVVRRLTRKSRKCGVDYPKDTVIIHEFPYRKGIPNIGHFVIKLETYLRIAKIPFQVNYFHENGPKNKTPWIEYNGITMGDSQLIIEFLNKEFSVNLNDHLSTLEVSQAWAIQKWIEEFTYWLNVATRWTVFGEETLSHIFGIAGIKGTVARCLLTSMIRKHLYTVGIGRHSNEEIQEMMINDIRHFTVLLGNKNFLMGDKISVVDCAAFGILSQVRWATPDKCIGRKCLLEQRNVMDYLDRIKNTYWTDWDTLVL